MASNTEQTRETIADLIDGRLPWPTLKSIIRGTKDESRWKTVLEVLQERVKFSERILLPLTEHLYIVQMEDDSGTVKCGCGHHFGDYRVNWKLGALIEVLESEESLEAVYPGSAKPDPELCEIRRYFCPGCAAQLEVESVPRGYPPLFEFLPDLEAFYGEWLDEKITGSFEFKDLSYEHIQAWELD